MAKKRTDLHVILESILGSSNVYFQPPESIKMKYPAIVYYLYRIDTDKADDTSFYKWNHYRIQYISRNPENEVALTILDLPYCSYNGRFVTDNLYHDNFDLYF